MQYRASQQKRSISSNFIQYEWVALKNVPALMQKCVIVAEDASFWFHHGIDWHEVWESLKVNLKRGTFSRGASTITQQLAKNLFLDPKKTLKRKFQELFIARKIEKHLSKKRILEIYLNVIEWGKNIYGIKSASKFYFQKMPSELTLDEMVRLAAVLPKPLELRPDKRSRELLWRSKIILNRLRKYGFIDEESYETALQSL